MKDATGFIEMQYFETLANEIPWIMAPAALIAALAIISLGKLLFQQKAIVARIIIVVTIVMVFAIVAMLMKIVPL